MQGGKFRWFLLITGTVPPLSCSVCLDLWLWFPLCSGCLDGTKTLFCPHFLCPSVPHITKANNSTRGLCQIVTSSLHLRQRAPLSKTRQRRSDAKVLEINPRRSRSRFGPSKIGHWSKRRRSLKRMINSHPFSNNVPRAFPSLSYTVVCSKSKSVMVSKGEWWDRPIVFS